MAIDPKLVSIIPASDLPTGDPTSAGQFFFYEGNEMKKAPMSNIYDKVNGSFSGTLMISDTPTPSEPTWYFAKEFGVYPNAGGLHANTEGNLVIFAFNGSVWSEIHIPIEGGGGAALAAIYNKNNSTEAVSAKSVEDYLFGYTAEAQSETFGEANVEKLTTQLSSSPGTFIIDTKHTRTIFPKQVKISVTNAGMLILGKCSMVDGKATHIYEWLGDTRPTLPVGINTVYLPIELRTLSPNEFLYYRQHNSSYVRVGGVLNAPTGYSRWTPASGGITTDTPVSEYTNARVGFQIIEGDEPIKVDGKMEKFLTKEISYPTPPDFGISQVTTTGFVKNTPMAFFRLSTGELIASCSSTAAGTSDHEPSNILLKKSNDNGTTWSFYSRIEKSGTDLGIYNGDFYYVGSTLHCVALVKTGTAPLRSKLVHLTSADNGKTWGEYTTIVAPDFYHVNSPQRVFRHNGIMFIPYSKLISGNGNSTSSTYYCNYIKSTDNGVTWVASGIADIVGSGAMIVEPFFFTNAAGLLTIGFRTRQGVIKARTSADNGATWSAESNLVTNVPNSMSHVVKLKNTAKWVAVHNDRVDNKIDGFATRKNLMISTSTDGVTFNALENLALAHNDQYFPYEPTIYEDRFTNGLLVSFSLSNADNSVYDAAFLKINYNEL